VSAEAEIVRALRARMPPNRATGPGSQPGEPNVALEPDLAWPGYEVAMVTADGWVTERAGDEGHAESWRDWLAPFDSFRIEFEELAEGPDGVVQMVRQVGVPHGSSAEIVAPGAAVFKFRDGRIARIEFHLSRERALRSAGLEPGQSSQPNV